MQQLRPELLLRGNLQRANLRPAEADLLDPGNLGGSVGPTQRVLHKESGIPPH